MLDRSFVPVRGRRPGRRAQVHRHHDERLGSMLGSLRELDGFGDGEASVSVGRSSLPKEVLSERIRIFGRPHDGFADGPPLPREAWRQLLGSHADYTGEPCATVPMSLGLLALPRTDAAPVSPFESEAGNPNSALGFCERFALPISEGRQRLRESGLARAYSDPQLLRSDRFYVGLLRVLFAAGIIELVDEPGVIEVGLFTVSKKDGRQRLVVDARPANFFFSEPQTPTFPRAPLLHN